MQIETETITIETTKPWLTYDSPRFLRVIEHFVRVKIFRQNDYFIDLWTIEDPAELVAVHGIDVEQELADILKEEIHKEMVLEYGPDYRQKQDEEYIKCLKKFAEENGFI